MAKEFESNGVKVEIPDELESVVALEYSFVEALAKIRNECHRYCWWQR